MAWYLNLLPLWSALAAGALALLAGLLAQRTMHVWDVKQQHRSDLVAEAIEPWSEETKRLLEYVRHRNLSQYVIVAPQPVSYAFRTNAPTGPWPFPENWPIWEKAREHWPHLDRAWSNLEKRQKDLDLQVQNLVSRLAEQLPLPPTGRFWDRQMDGDPQFGTRWAACELWQLYWKSQEKPKNQWKTLEESVAKTRWLRSKNQPLSEELSQLAKHFFYGPDNHDELDTIRREASTIEGRLLEFKQELLRVAYDKNLTRRCDFCPQFRPRRKLSKRG